jgi:hypothetical protein
MDMFKLNAKEEILLVDFAGLRQNSRLQVTDEFIAPPVILRIGDSIIGTLGNFSASTGKAKSKKTFHVCAIVASALNNNRVLNYSASLPENKRRILYVDTEQSKFHCQKVLKHILQLAGLPVDIHPETMEFLSLRKFSSKIRMGIIEEAICHTENPGLAVIDGVCDLAYDISHSSFSSYSHSVQKDFNFTVSKLIHSRESLL